MKKLKKLSLANVVKDELKKRELNRICGGGSGDCCICAHGTANAEANIQGGLYSPIMMGYYSTFRN